MCLVPTPYLKKFQEFCDVTPSRIVYGTNVLRSALPPPCRVKQPRRISDLHLFNQKYLTIEGTSVTATDVFGEVKKLKKVKREKFVGNRDKISRKWKKLEILSLMNLRNSFYAVWVSYMDMREGKS